MEWKIQIYDKDKYKDRYIEVITRGIADKNSSLNMAKAIASGLFDTCQVGRSDIE